MTSPISIVIDGQEFSDWLNAEFHFSLDDGASTFQFTVSERWQGNFFRQWTRWQIPAGGAVEVYVERQLVLTGYIDVHEPNVSAGEHTVSIGGRSKTGDLVDCAIVRDGLFWENQSADQIIADICLPFGITTSADIDLRTIRRFQVESGTTAWEAIRQIAEKSGGIVVPTVGGGIEITQASSNVLPFELSCPKSILVRHDLTNRFSDWIVNGQQHGFDENPITAAQVTGEVRDTGVTRYRPVIIDQQGETDGLDAQSAAEWRKSRSIGESLSARITIPEFKNPDGDIWWPNNLIQCRFDPVGLDRDLLISSVRFSFDGNSGTECVLELKHPAAYSPKPEVRSTSAARRARSSDYFEQVDKDVSAQTSSAGQSNVQSIFDVPEFGSTPTVF